MRTIENKIQSIETKLNEILSRFWIPVTEQEKVCQFLYHCINKADNFEDYSYNVLIECRDKEKGIELAREITSAGGSFFDIVPGNFDKVRAVDEESVINRFYISGDAKNLPLFAIITKMIPDSPENWNSVYEMAQRSNKILKIYVKQFDEKIERLENDKFFSWRFLNLHIRLDDMQIDDVIDCLLKRIELLGVKYDDSFKNGVSEHIKTIYGDAYLKDEFFVNDLIAAIKAKASGRAKGFIDLDKDDVPYDKKTGGDAIIKERGPADESVETVDTESIVENHKKENVLVLALSTRSQNNEKSGEFRVYDELSDKYEIIPDCIYQLEPIAKYMIQKCKGETINIIELCTGDTLECLKENKKNPDDLRSAKEFFENRIDEYKDKYRCNIVYNKIDINEDAMSEGLVKVAETLKGYKDILSSIGGDTQKKGVLWVDTHGGFRDVTIMCNSLISLLKTYGIRPDKIYGVRFADRKQNEKTESENKYNRVVDQQESFAVNEFVAGMNEFIEYGSASILEKYYNVMPLTNDKIKRIVEAMKKVSDGTKLCDPTIYIDALDELAEAVNDYGNGTGEIFDIFVDYIRADYGVLFDKGKRNNIDIVKRCAKKEMYQQALTFIESLMPSELFKKGILYYDEKDDEVVRQLSVKAGKKYLGPNHFMFDSYLYDLDYFTNEKEKVILDDIKRKTGEAIKNLKRNNDKGAILALRNTAHLNTEFNIPNGVVAITARNDVKLGQIEVFSNVSDKITRKEIGKLIRLHKALKDCRNMANHASANERPSKKEIEQGIDKYIEIVQKIYKSDELSKPFMHATGKTKIEEIQKEDKSYNNWNNQKQNSSKGSNGLTASLGDKLSKLNIK